jgi:hypothetical protein
MLVSQPAEETRSWLPDVSNGELIGFVLWVVVEFALALAATLAIVHRAVALPKGDQLQTHFLVGWGATWGVPMLVLSALAGTLVFRRTAPWDVVLTWPWLIGVAVFFACEFGLGGQMDQGSRLCGQQSGGCDLSFGFGSALVGGAAAVILGVAFVAAASLKRLLVRNESRLR